MVNGALDLYVNGHPLCGQQGTHCLKLLNCQEEADLETYVCNHSI